MSTDTAISGTSISVATDRISSQRVFYQLLNGRIDERGNLDGIWSNSHLNDVSPVSASPLASVIYYRKGNQEIRLYYLDTEYVIRELAYTDGKGWCRGEIDRMNVRATPTAGLSALVYSDQKYDARLRVYYQEAGTNVIAELANDGYWRSGKLRLAGALGGTSIAAASCYFHDQTRIHVYYQSMDLSLKEHCYDHDGGWSAGEFNPGIVTAQSPLSALAFDVMQLQVYWRDLDGHVVYRRYAYPGPWGPTTLVECVPEGYKFAALQWENGTYLRLYFQEFRGSVVEYCSDDGGATWVKGEVILHGKFCLRPGRTSPCTEHQTAGKSLN